MFIEEKKKNYNKKIKKVNNAKRKKGDRVILTSLVQLSP